MPISWNLAPLKYENLLSFTVRVLNIPNSKFESIYADRSSPAGEMSARDTCAVASARSAVDIATFPRRMEAGEGYPDSTIEGRSAASHTSRDRRALDTDLTFQKIMDYHLSQHVGLSFH